MVNDRYLWLLLSSLDLHAYWNLCCSLMLCATTWALMACFTPSGVRPGSQAARPGHRRHQWWLLTQHGQTEQHNKTSYVKQDCQPATSLQPGRAVNSTIDSLLPWPCRGYCAVPTANEAGPSRAVPSWPQAASWAV